MNAQLNDRWRTDANFMNAIDFLLVKSVDSDSNQLQEWYSTLPKVTHPFGGESADFRSMQLEGVTLGRVWLCYVLDDTIARSCRFIGTRFQGASLRRCDFSGSQFDGAQLSPVCADGASFAGCTFEQCFMMAEPRPLDGAEVGSFRNCDFSRVSARRTDWDAADLRGAKLSQARLDGCRFVRANLLGVNLAEASFSGCDFAGARLSDTPQNRKSVALGNNARVDEIEWLSLPGT
jgi:uncharacterized protein YjbI with pentapeptide repeats